ncbi:hypothetical protein [Streptomyces sclerotialus]|uniref:hypothetical protein n=1 Tax=Streptomyces sclerotialus TaxID=1957 RepID=UPI00068C2F69
MNSESLPEGKTVTGKWNRRLAAESVGDAEAAVRELRDVLARAGVVLPSLRLDLISCAYETPRPLVEFGRCTVGTARKLIAVLQEREKEASEER